MMKLGYSRVRIGDSVEVSENETLSYSLLFRVTSSELISYPSGYTSIIFLRI